jgi:hypothetical protein
VDALKPALVPAGWKSRAAGWFTKDLRPGIWAVVAVSAASTHHAAGSASVTMMLGLRDEATQELVEQVTGPQTPRYQGRTWVTPLGYLVPDPSYSKGERDFDERNASTQAGELAHLLITQAEPRLRQIANDASELTALAELSTSSMGPSGLCRIATLLARTKGTEAASEYVTQRLAALRGRTDPAADLERGLAPSVLALLDAD